MDERRAKPDDIETYSKDEYVLNQSGCVYRGSAFTKGAKEWNFGQVGCSTLYNSLL